MSIIHVSNDKNIDYLKQFILNELPTTFRYFNSRTIDIINNHIITVLYIIDNTPVGYAHIDYNVSDNKHWFGICILNVWQKKGIGKCLINYVIQKFKSMKSAPVYLAVDNDNLHAKKLYLSTGFKEIEFTKKYTIMELVDTLLYLPVSYGEALDKLTILDIKRSKITDASKLADVENEYLKLYTILEKDILKYQFLYSLLKTINLDIWIKQDIFRYSTDETEKNKLCKDIISLNDSRFRIKNKINMLTSSSIKEQKSYIPNKAVILTHLGLGDNITATPAVRYFSTLYDEIIVIAKKRNAANVRSFYADDPTIFILEINDDDSDLYVDNKKMLRTLAETHKIITCGCHSPSQKPYTYLPFNFYDDMGLSYSIFWDYFHIPSNEESKEMFKIIRDNNISNYIFMHNTSSQGIVFNSEKALNHFNINKNDTLIINPNINMYNESDIFYDIAKQFINKPLIQYVDTLINADMMLMSDSSFVCISMLLPLKSTQNYLISRGIFAYEHIWDTKYGYNETKKQRKFTCLTL
jgi:GNAT superfamily N-acetyltransferase